MKIASVIVLVFFQVLSGFTQQTSDSLLVDFEALIYKDVSLSIKKAEQALKLAEEEKNKLNIALSKKALGTAYYFKEIHQTAALFLLESRNSLKQLNQTQELAFCGNNLALVYEEVGLFKLAGDIYFDNIKYFESNQDTNRLCQTYNNLGIIFEKLGEYDNALEYYNLALDLNVEEKRDLKASLFLNIGIVYDIKSIEDSALFYYNKSLDLYKELEYPMFTSYVYSNISALYLKKGDYNKSLEYQKISYEIEDKESNIQLLTRYNIANIHYKQGQYSKAHEYAIVAYNQDEKAGNLSDYYYVVKLLKDIYHKTENHSKAFQFAEKQLEIKDQLNDELKVKELKKLHIEFETEKKEQEIYRLEADKKIIQQESDIQRLFKNIAISGVIAIALIVLLLINRIRIRKRLFKQKEELITAREQEAHLQLKNERLEKESLIKEQKHREEQLKVQAEYSRLEAEKLNAELEHKNRELGSTALSTLQKNEILSKIDLKIQTLEKEHGLKGNTELRELKFLIKENKNNDNDWDNFKIHFDNIHPDFYAKLSSQYSELSLNDLRHCAYIKVKLSSKEIARIMNITPKSVQTSRYRLKKKFGLSPEVDLVEFVQQLS